jgi:hypothetical protein
VRFGPLSLSLASPQSPAAPQGETALSHQIYGVLTTLLEIPDDRDMHGLTVEQADEMERRDDMVRAALALKRCARLGTGHDIQPASKRPDHVQHADFCRYVFKHMAGTTSTVLNEMMFGFHRGFSVHELVWMDAPYTSGPFRGKIGFARIKAKSPLHLSFKTDEFGELLPDGLWQEKHLAGIGEMNPRDLYRHLDVNRFMIYVHDKRDDNWYGQSDLRSAWRPYLLKNDVFPAWKDFMVRFGAPVLIASIKGNINSTQRAQVSKFVEKLRRGTSALLPEGMSVEDLVAKLAQTHTSTYQDAITTCDKAIGRSVLMPSLVLDEGERSGSLALGKQHATTFLSVLEYEGVVISDAFNEQAIRRLIDMNFPGADDYPELVFRPFSDQDMKPLAEVVKTLVEAGYPPSAEWVNEKLGIPIEEAQDGPEPEDEAPSDDMPEDDTPPDGEPPVSARSRVSFAGAADRYWRRPTALEDKVDFAALETIEAAEFDETSAAIVGIIAAAREEVVARLGKVRPEPRPRSSESPSPRPCSETCEGSLSGTT